jgi:hypothetical protein
MNVAESINVDHWDSHWLHEEEKAQKTYDVLFGALKEVNRSQENGQEVVKHHDVSANAKEVYMEGLFNRVFVIVLIKLSLNALVHEEDQRSGHKEWEQDVNSFKEGDSSVNRHWERNDKTGHIASYDNNLHKVFDCSSKVFNLLKLISTVKVVIGIFLSTKLPKNYNGDIHHS